MLKLLTLMSLMLTATACSRFEKIDKIDKTRVATLPQEITETTSQALVILDSFSCPITPKNLEKISIPPLYKSNNLRKRIGYSSEAEGEKIIISGLLTDSNCMPIGNARVDIWQADSKGYYKSFQPNPYLNDQRLYNKSKSLFTENYDTSNKADENFTGSGSITTDNLGRFYFFTIKPGSHDKKSPRIHIRVSHKGFPEFRSLLFFPEDKKADPLQKPLKKLGSDEKNYHYKVTLAGENLYKKP